MMTYTITINLEEEEVHTEDAKRVVNYLGEVLARMGYSYQINCQRDGMKMMMGLQSPSAQDSD
jgi:predicted RNA-binding protein Jag